jgi:hypothetical protein
VDRWSRGPDNDDIACSAMYCLHDELLDNGVRGQNL